MWYQYTEDRGVYTLTPVNGYTKDVNGIAPAEERSVNSSKVYLSSTTYTGSFGTGNSYGEDASIYITVDNGDVDTLVGGDAITEVTGVYTGAQDVNLVVPSQKWIHAVWKDNYIVAAIVYGDAEGTVENYAYIRDGISREWIEEDGSGNRTHYWEFDAVMNGEKVTKTIKSRFSNTVNYLKPGQVQELIIDNDGYVTSIKDVSYPGNSVREDKLYNNSDFRNNTTNGKDTLKGNNVYHVETGLTTDLARQNGVLMPNLNVNGETLLAFQGNTLRYSASNNDLALPVARNAKAVVSQIINGSTKWENYDSVSSAYSILNDADGDSTTNVNGAKQFDGQVIAVLDSNGVAAWVIFIDNTPTNTTDSSGNINASNTIGNTDVYVRGSNVNIVGRNIGATISRTGNLTVSIPVSSDVVSASASRITVTVDGVYRYDDAYSFVIRGNQAQFTLTGEDLDANNDIVVTIYNFNANTGSTQIHNVNVTLSAPTAGNALPNATTTTTGVNVVTTWDKTGPAVAGQTYTATITVTAQSGYTLASGWTLNVNGNANAAGTVSFTLPSEDGVTVSYPDHSAVYTVADGVYTLVPNGGTVEKGATIQIDPIEVMDVTGVTVNEDGEGTVGEENITVTPKANAKWNLAWNMWRITLDDQGNYDLIPFNPRTEIPARFARTAMVTASAEVGDDITEEENWVEILKNDKGATYEQKAGDVTWTITVKDTGAIQIRVKGSYTKEQIDAAFEAMDNGKHSVVKVDGSTPPAKTYALYLDDLLGKSVDEGKTKVRILGKGGKELEPTFDKVPENSKTRACYEIPVGASVSIVCSDAACMDASIGMGIHKIDGIEIEFVSVSDTGPLNLNFTMPEKDVRLWLQAHNGFAGDSGKVIKVTSEGGVEATFTATVNGSAVSKTLEANGVVELPSGQSWTIKVTNKGEGSAVWDTISGNADDFDWAADANFNKDQSGFMLHGDAVLYSGYKVKTNNNISVTTSKGTASAANGVIVVPAGEEIKVGYTHGTYAGAEPEEISGILALTGDFKTRHAKAGDANVLTGKIGVHDTYKVAEDVEFVTASKFVLDEGVSASYTWSDKTSDLTSGTWYMSASFNTWYSEVQNGSQKAQMVGHCMLEFKNPGETGVVNRNLIGNEADIVMGYGDNGAYITNTAKVATATYVVESQAWDGDTFESWTIVKTDGIDEGYLDNGRGTTMIFGDVYQIGAANDNNAQKATTNGRVAVFGRVAKTFFLDNDKVSETLVVYGGNGATEIADNITEDAYEITLTGAEAIEGWKNPFFGVSKTAWAAFDADSIGTGTIELKAVAK